MESIFLQLLSKESLWAALCVFLFMYTIKGVEKREELFKERETKYQLMISELTNKNNILSELKSEITRLKKIFDKNIKN